MIKHKDGLYLTTNFQLGGDDRAKICNAKRLEIIMSILEETTKFLASFALIKKSIFT